MSKTGQWREAQAALRELRRDLRPIYEGVLLREGLRYQEAIVRYIRDQKVRPKVKPFTLAMRRLPGRVNKGGFGGTNTLMVRGNLWRGIKVHGPRGRWPNKWVFIGIKKSARVRGANDRWAGQLINLARLHEFGSKPFFVTVTPKMRRFWFFLWQRGVVSGPLKPSTTQLGPIKIPARPYIRPTFKRERRRSKRRMRRELRRRVSAVLKAHGAR